MNEDMKCCNDYTNCQCDTCKQTRILRASYRCMGAGQSSVAAPQVSEVIKEEIEEVQK